MSDRTTARESGFSLIEMVVAMAVGTLVVGAGVQIYSQGVAATWTVTQRAELQQDFRAASNMLTKDLSLAGAGLNPGTAIALPPTATPVYGCAGTAGSQTTATCYLNSANNSAVSYPVQAGTPYLYGLVTGYDDGPTLNAAQGATDIVTVAYTDSSFYLDCYLATITSTTSVTFTAIVPTPPATTSANCTSPTGNTGAQAVNDSVVGLTAGDLVLFNLGGTQVVAEVTTAATAAGVVDFVAGDVLKMNQAAAVANTLASEYVVPNLAAKPPIAPTTGYASRLLVITYYIDNTQSVPRLMRQISGHAPMPVAENVVYLKFSYDLYNATTNSPAVACTNPDAATDGCAGASAGLLPNQITKINIANMAMDSTLTGSVYAQSGYQRMDLQTSVSARNLTYTNDYAIP